MSGRGCFLMLAVLTGCGDALPPPYRVDGPRLLGISVEPPASRPGATIVLRALTHGFELSHFEWSWCGADKIDVSCSEGPGGAIASGAALSETSFIVPDREGAILLWLRIDGLAGYKRLDISEHAERTWNPEITDLSAPRQAPAHSELILQVEVAPAPSRDDRGLVTSWFATAGEFASARSIGVPIETTWRAPNSPGNVEIWAVVRDGEGGVAWETREINVVP